jgi:hypothetical protein
MVLVLLGDPRSQRRASIRGFGASAIQGMLVENPLFGARKLGFINGIYYYGGVI